MSLFFAELGKYGVFKYKYEYEYVSVFRENLWEEN